MPTVTVEYHCDTLILCNGLGFVFKKKKKKDNDGYWRPNRTIG